MHSVQEVDEATKGGQLEALITKGKEQAEILKKEQQVIEEKKKEKAERGRGESVRVPCSLFHGIFHICIANTRILM